MIALLKPQMLPQQASSNSKRPGSKRAGSAQIQDYADDAGRFKGAGSGERVQESWFHQLGFKRAGSRELVQESWFHQLIAIQVCNASSCLYSKPAMVTVAALESSARVTVYSDSQASSSFSVDCKRGEVWRGNAPGEAGLRTGDV